jgi:hypothetical protein
MQSSKLAGKSRSEPWLEGICVSEVSDMAVWGDLEWIAIKNHLVNGAYGSIDGGPALARGRQPGLGKADPCCRIGPRPRSVGRASKYPSKYSPCPETQAGPRFSMQ